jgi:dsRNA-specific ribonuclease
MQTEFTRAGVTIIFFQLENDEKYSFRIKDDTELTQKILDSVNTKRVKEKNIKYAVNGIFDLIKTNNFQPKPIKSISMNTVTELNETVQARFKGSVTTNVVLKTGPDHNPTLTVDVILPDHRGHKGNTYRGTGSNRKIAAQNAAQKALDDAPNW